MGVFYAYAESTGFRFAFLRTMSSILQLSSDVVFENLLFFVNSVLIRQNPDDAAHTSFFIDVSGPVSARTEALFQFIRDADLPNVQIYHRCFLLRQYVLYQLIPAVGVFLCLCSQ